MYCYVYYSWGGSYCWSRTAGHMDAWLALAMLVTIEVDGDTWGLGLLYVSYC